MHIRCWGVRSIALVCALGLAGCGGSDHAGLDDSRAPIEILIDDMGVPHIYAATDELAFYGAGYQMATDRLYQMEMLRRFALGRLSEVLGEKGLERDLQARIFNFGRWGREDAELMKTEDPERVTLINAWVKGINRRIAEVRSGDAPLPFGYGPGQWDFLPEPWQEADPYIMLKAAAFGVGKTIEFEIAISLLSLIYSKAMNAVEIFKPAHAVFGIPPEDRPVFSFDTALPLSLVALQTSTAAKDLRPGVFTALARGLASLPHHGGSNNWAVDGRFTKTGCPLIAGDPHLAFDFLGAPYPMHINSTDAGGTYNVAGFAYPGTPGIALGHNNRVIWTATSAFGDVNDIWNIIRWGSYRILLGNELVPITAREEQIIVRGHGNAAGEGQIVTMVYEDVEGFGVLVPREVMDIPLGGPYLTNWTGFGARPSRWFMELNRVSSLDEFEDAVDRMREMDYNLVAADAQGIAFRVGVDVPLRADTSGDRAPWRAMNSWDAGSLWTGEMLPRSLLPGSRAAERGWLATANNDPFGFTEDGRADNDPWYYGAFFDPGYRAKRIADELERLTQRGDMTIEDMMDLQRDVYSTLADDLLPHLADAHDRIDADDSLARFRGQPDVDRLVQLLITDWDRRMARDSAGALAFQAFLHFLTAATLKDDLPLAYDFAMSLQAVFVIKVAAMALRGEFPEGNKVVQEGRDVVMLKAASDTAAWLRNRFGSVEPSHYTYADRKVTLFDDAFGYGVQLFSRPTDGGEDTINVSQNISFSEEADRWVTTYVSVERTVGTFAKDGTPEAYVNFPVAAHADPYSSETMTANEDYIEGRYRKLLFRRAEIEAAAQRRIELLPE